MHPCWSIGCKNIKGQSWRLIKNLPSRPAPGSSGSKLAALAIFFATSNFDLKYFCNLLTYKNVQYLIWKIWFISFWSQISKVMVWVLIGFILGQCTPISYYTEANGCIFFATAVPSKSLGMKVVRIWQCKHLCIVHTASKAHISWSHHLTSQQIFTRVEMILRAVVILCRHAPTHIEMAF